MAQVTMDGKEYVELMHTVQKAEAESQLLVKTLIMGTFEVDATSQYRKVNYKCAAELQDTEEMHPYMDMRIKDVAEKLGQNPLAVQLLYTAGETFFNPLTGYFTTYGWDSNVAVADMSKELGDMITKLENGEVLVVVEEEEEE